MIISKILPMDRYLSKSRKQRSTLLNAACISSKLGSVVTEAVADVSGDISSFPGVKQSVGIAATCIAATCHLAKAGFEMAQVALGCESIPFDEIKEVMNEKFEEANRKMDLRIKGLEGLVKLVSKFEDANEKVQLSMKQDFSRLVNEINNISVKSKIDQISNFCNYFHSESRRINGLENDDYIAKLEEPDNILILLKDSRTPEVDSLYTAMNDIILNNEAIPKDEDDVTAFQALFALFYGAQTYVALFGFLLKSHSYLANHYYKNGDFEAFNEELDTISNVFDDFKSSLIDDTSGFLPKLSEVLETVKNKEFIGDVSDNLYLQVSTKNTLLEFLTKTINDMTIPIIEDTPSAPWIEFNSSFQYTPICSWKEGSIVKYAVQYEYEGHYSKLSEWSDPHIVRRIAFPNVYAVEDPRQMLVFRKIDDDPAQLVYTMPPFSRKFKDTVRDMFDAAGKADAELGLEEIKATKRYPGSVPSLSFEFGRTTFHNAAKSGNLLVFNFLKKYSSLASLNIRDQNGYTPLHVAVENGHLEYCEALLNARANTNLATYTEGYTPLHLAVLNGFKEIVSLLVNWQGVNVNAKDKHGFTPLHLTIKGGARLITTVMESENVNVNAKSNTGLTLAHLAGIKGEFRWVRILSMEPSFNPNEIDINGLNLLHYAAMLGNTDMINKMLNKVDIRVNLQASVNKWTPLHYAVFFKKTEVALRLISHPETNLGIVTSDNLTPLHMAAATGQISIIQALVNKSVNLDVECDSGDTALHLSVLNNCQECVQLLIENGANIEAKNIDDRTPQDLAIELGRKVLEDYIESKSSGRFKKHLDFTRNSNPIHKMESLELKTETKGGSHPYSLLSKNYDRESIANYFNKVDGNNTLLLLYVLLRKVTNKKFILPLRGNLSEMEANAEALKIVEKFENFLEDISSVPIKEQIDLVEVSSRIKKDLMRRGGTSVVSILSYYAGLVQSSKPIDLRKLLETV